MTLKELKFWVDKYMEERPDNAEKEVVIRTIRSVMGTSGNTKVKNIQKGIDWDKKMIWIYPEEDLIPKNKGVVN